MGVRLSLAKGIHWSKDELFWSSIGTQLLLQNPSLTTTQQLTIHSVDDLDQLFSLRNGMFPNQKVVLIIDNAQQLFRCTENIRRAFFLFFNGQKLCKQSSSLWVLLWRVMCACLAIVGERICI